MAKINHHRRAFLFALQQGRCAFCGRACCFDGPEVDPGFWTLEHVLPRMLDGDNAMSNLVGCCRSCNEQRKRDMDTVDRAVFIAKCLAERHFINANRVLFPPYRAEFVVEPRRPECLGISFWSGMLVPSDLTPRLDLVFSRKCDASDCSRVIVTCAVRRPLYCSALCECWEKQKRKAQRRNEQLAGPPRPECAALDCGKKLTAKQWLRLRKYCTDRCKNRAARQRKRARLEEQSTRPMATDDSNDMATRYDDLEQGLPADAIEALRESEKQIEQGLVMPLEEAIARIRAEVGI